MSKKLNKSKEGSIPEEISHSVTETIVTPSLDVLTERVNNLSAVFNLYFTQNIKMLENVGTKLDNIHEKVTDLDIKVGIQNGRVGNIEEREEKINELINKINKFQDKCPGIKTSDEFNTFKKDMKLWHVISTNWKIILLFVVGTSIVINYIPPLFRWVITTVSSLFEVGL
jgi:hypothetical protein